MQNNYLIPANTKKSMLILGFFTGRDLFIFSVGLLWSFAMLFFVNLTTITVIALVMLPALIGTFLVMPVPHYHNVLQLITNIVTFFTNRRQYYWRGWCVNEEFTNRDK